MTLQEILSNGLEYSNSWAVYAEVNEKGEFDSKLAARFGQTQFENGGLLDGFKLFGTNTQIYDFLCDWNPEDLTDGIDELIFNANELTH
jgi:hypothetical protein